MTPCAHLRLRGPRCLDCGRRRARPSVPVPVPIVPGLDATAVVGAGATAVVVRGGVRDGRPVVVKVARDAEADGVLVQEAAHLRALAGAAVARLEATATSADGRVALVLEDVGDDSLAARLEREAVGVAEVGALAAALLVAVETVHERGFVHGDLEPAHVRLRANGEVVLVDLGAARPIGNEPRAAVVGTIEYVAPELLGAARPAATVAAELYAVGAIVHELATGRPPFIGGPEEVRAGHLQQRPWIDRHRAGVAAALVEWIGRCLAKAPADRFPSARAAREALIAGTTAPPGIGVERSIDPANAGAPASIAAARAARPIDPAAPAFEPMLVEAPLVGRDRPLAALLDSARGAVRHRMPTLATVVAEPGHGKTRFAARLRELLGAEGRVIAVAGAAGAGPDAVVRALAASLLGPAWGSREALAHVLGPVVADEVWPGVAASQDPSLIGARVDAGSIGATGAAVAIGAAPGAIRAALVRAVGEAMLACAREAPLHVVLDDAHLADDAALDACEYATGAGAELPLWIGVLARPDLDRLRPAWGERAERHERVKLPALPPEAAAALVRALLAPATEVPDAFVDAVVARAQGVPLLIHELVAQLRRAGAIRRHPRGDGWYVAGDLEAGVTAPSIDDVIAREVEAMGPSLAAYARLIAILAAPVTSAELAILAAQLDEAGYAFVLDPGLAIAQLQRRGLLAPRGAGVTIRHALVGDALARGADPGLTTAIHRAAHAWIAASAPVGAEDPFALLARRARHARGGGLRDEAIAAYQVLARGALARHAYLEAERCLGACLELIDLADHRAQRAAHHDRGTARFRLGRYDDALVDLAAAIALADALDEAAAAAHALLDAATILDWIDEFVRSAEHVARAAARLPATAPPALQARLRVGQGRTAWRAGDQAIAAAALAEAIALASACGDDGYETAVVGRLLLGTIQAAAASTVDAAEATFAALIAECTAHRDRLHLAAALNNRRHVWLARGALDALIADADACIAIGRELGVLAFEYGARINVGEALLDAGRLADARREIERAVGVEARRSSRLTARVLEVRLLLREGRPAEAAQRHAALQAALAAGGVLTSSDRIELDRLALGP